MLFMDRVKNQLRDVGYTSNTASWADAQKQMHGDLAAHLQGAIPSPDMMSGLPRARAGLAPSHVELPGRRRAWSMGSAPTAQSKAMPSMGAGSQSPAITQRVPRPSSLGALAWGGMPIHAGPSFAPAKITPRPVMGPPSPVPNQKDS
jgi:hypothetical protein